MAACFYRLADELGNEDAHSRLYFFGTIIGMELIDVIDVISDVQDELAIVDAVCIAASDASDETREAALQWLLTQHHDEVLMLVCDLRVEHVFSS